MTNQNCGDFIYDGETIMITLNAGSTTFQPFKTGALTKPTISITKVLDNWLPVQGQVKTWVHTAHFRAVLDDTFQQFAQKHPVWVSAMFDRAFLQQNCTLLTTSYITDGVLPTADTLVTAWDKQLGPASPRVRERTNGRDYTCGQRISK